MGVERRVVTDRVFLLGLDELYRDGMKRHERGTLLDCARRVARELHAGPAEVPVDGYYTEDEELTVYFRLMRALQDVSEQSSPQVETLREFQRLLAIASSPLYGPSANVGKLLPVGEDALSLALRQTFPDWTLDTVTDAARRVALERHEISLVGLAARARDTLVLAALRESVVLYAMAVAGAALPARLEYVWDVDEELAAAARELIRTFNSLFDDALAQPEEKNAATFWHACGRNEVAGRCVRLGYDDRVDPVQHYHWAIAAPNRVEEFWKPEIWTIERYRKSLGFGPPLSADFPEPS